jgi:hypothetical protein
MDHSHNEQQQSATQSHSATCSPQSTVNYSSSPALNPANASEQQLRHYLSNISRPVLNKLIRIGVFYILAGLIIIGLEIGLYIRHIYG